MEIICASLLKQQPSPSCIPRNASSLKKVVKVMSSNARPRETPGQRFERRINRRKMVEDAKAQVRKDEKAKAIKEDVNPDSDDGEELPQQRTSPTTDSETLPHSRRGGSIPLPATPPSYAPRSMFDESPPRAGNSGASAINSLRSQLQTEREQRRQLEQELEIAKRQQIEYTAARDATQTRLDQAVVDDDQTMVAKLQRQLQNSWKMLRDCRDEILRLEDELNRKNRTIAELSREPANRNDGVQERATPSTPQGGPKTPPAKLLLVRSESGAGWEVLRGPEKIPLPTPLGSVLT